MLVRGDGSVLDKTRVLADLQTNDLRFRSIELWNEAVRLHESIAILTGESRTVSNRGDVKTTAHFRLIAIYSKNSEAIKLEYFQATPLPD